MRDSLTQDPGSRFVTNTYQVSNQTGQEMRARIQLTAPRGWQILKALTEEVVLQPFETKVFALNVLSTPVASAEWEAFRIDASNESNAEQTAASFALRAQRVEKFSSELSSETVLITAPGTTVDFPVYLRNRGNTPGRYTVRWSSPFLGLNKTSVVNLEGGKDTTLIADVTINARVWKMLNSTSVEIDIAAANGERDRKFITLGKKSSAYLKHEHQYERFGISLENLVNFDPATGNIGSSTTMRGTASVLKNLNLSYQWGTNLLSTNAQTGTQPFLVDMQYKGLSVYYGNVGGLLAGSGGQGVRLAFQSGGKFAASAFTTTNPLLRGTRHYGGDVRFPLSKRISLSTAAYYSTDTVPQATQLLVQANAAVSLKYFRLGAGVERSICNYPINGQLQAIVGEAYQGTLGVRTKSFTLQSRYSQASPDYAGFMRGAFSSVHEAEYLLKAVRLQANYTKTHNQRDEWSPTEYRTGIASGRIEEYGLATGYERPKSTHRIRVASRSFRNGVTDGEFGALSRFAEIGTALRRGRTTAAELRVSLGQTTIGQQTHPYYTVNTNTAWKWFSMLAVYSRGANTQFIQTSQIQGSGSEFISLRPTLNFSFFKKHLFTIIQYNYEQMPGSARNTSACNASLGYQNTNLGLHIQAQAFMYNPGSASQSMQFTTVLRKDLSLPILWRKHYHNLDLQFYHDINTNDTLDAVDTLLPAISATIEERRFVSGKRGRMRYRNVEAGTYEIDLSQAGAPAGVVPSAGAVQQISVHKNTRVAVPFKQGKVVTGSVTAERDSTSEIVLSVANYKITATAENGQSFTTASRSDGTFLFNLPAGRYTISMNPAAFNDKVRPVQMAFDVDLRATDQARVNFVIKPQRRQMNIRRAAPSN